MNSDPTRGSNGLGLLVHPREQSFSGSVRVEAQKPRPGLLDIKIVAAHTQNAPPGHPNRRRHCSEDTPMATAWGAAPDALAVKTN